MDDRIDAARYRFLRDFVKRNFGVKCGRCGERVGFADEAREELVRLSDSKARALAQTGNYVANTETAPTRVLFANGRLVEIRGGSLYVGWAHGEAERVFAAPAEGSSQ